MDFLEDAGEMRKLLKRQVVGDGFDRFARNDASVGLGETNMPHPIGNGHAVVLREAPLEGAQGNMAETCQFARAVIRLASQCFPVCRP